VFSPDLRPGRDVDQLGFNIEFVAMLNNSPGQHRIDVQIVPDP